MLASVLDTLALIRLWLSLSSDLCCELTNLLLINTLDNDLVLSFHNSLNTFWISNFNRVRISKVQHELLALQGRAVADEAAGGRGERLVAGLDVDDADPAVACGEEVFGGLAAALAALDLPPGAEVLGPVPVAATGPPAPDGPAPLRAVVRVPRAAGAALSRTLREMQGVRAARKLPPVRTMSS